MALRLDSGSWSPLTGSHDSTHTHHIRKDSSGHVISPTHRPLPDKKQHLQQTNIHTTGGIRTRNTRKRAASDPQLRPCDHRAHLIETSRYYSHVFNRCAGIIPETNLERLLLKQLLSTFINRLTPNDPYMGRTAPLTSKRFILYIYSTNIGAEYFKHALYSPFFSFQNAVCFIMLTCLVPVLFTFCIQDVLKSKKIIPAPKG